MKNFLFFILSIFISVTCMSTELSLDQFLKIVEEQNLLLKLENAKNDSAKASATGIRLPPPMISLIQMTPQSGSKSRGFEVSQQIPFPSKLSSDRSARKLNEEAQEKNLESMKSEIIAKAKLSFIQLWIAQERLLVLNQKKKIIEEHLRLAQSVVRSDSFLKIHLLKAESDFDLLENEISSAKQMLKEKQLLITEMANQNFSDFNPVALTPPLSSLPAAIDHSATPQIQSLKLLADSMKARESEARSSWMPEFELKYKKMNEADMSPAYTEAMVGITLPFLFFWQPQSETAAAKSETLQAELNLNRERRLLETKIASLYGKVESLQNQLDKIKTQLLPRAEKRMKIVHNLAPRDMETLQDHRETMEAFPELKMTELALRAEYEEAVSELLQYVSNKGQANE